MSILINGIICLPDGYQVLGNVQNQNMENYYIDQYEVSNESYKAFIDNGGYVNKDYWKEPFIRDGKEISWEEAMKLFVDKTGQPGPSTWEIGDYPNGQMIIR